MTDNTSFTCWYRLVDGNGTRYKFANAAKLDVSEKDDVADFVEKVKLKNPIKLSSFDANDLLVFKDYEELMRESGKPWKSSQLLKGYGIDEETAVIVQVPDVADLRITPRKRKLSDQSVPLVTSVGMDFAFQDRDPSFQILADCLENRYQSWILSLGDKSRHPLPFLADGPGAGKSRFLQELSSSFKAFVLSRSETYKGLASIMEKTFFVNVTFGNGEKYDKSEFSGDILKSVCYRILLATQNEMEKDEAEIEVKRFFDDRSSSLAFEPFLQNIAPRDSACIFLGIDEINYVYKEDVHEFKRLFNKIGSLSCKFKPFFVGIFAGTVIGPMSSVVCESTHPPLHIPLPLLSFESCLEILGIKEPNLAKALTSDQHLRLIVEEMGGHCRALEVLYQRLLPYCRNRERLNYDLIVEDVRNELAKRYALSPSFFNETVIAKYFLSDVVSKDCFITPGGQMTWENLEEMGIIKLVETGHGKLVMMPPIFVRGYLYNASGNPAFQFWRDIFLCQPLLWQCWETFNANYFAFRLSLFSADRRSPTSLQKIFAGAISRLDETIDVVIPPFDQINVTQPTRRYPSTPLEEFPDGGVVLNTAGAAFDAFTYLSRPDGKRILLVFQMKLSLPSTKTPQRISNKMIDNEYAKVRETIEKHLNGMDFVFVLVGRRERCRNFDEGALPKNCFFISNSEQGAFYGDYYCRRISIC